MNNEHKTILCYWLANMYLETLKDNQYKGKELKLFNNLSIHSSNFMNAIKPRTKDGGETIDDLCYIMMDIIDAIVDKGITNTIEEGEFTIKFKK